MIAASVVPLVMDTGRILALDLVERHDPIEQALNEVGSDFLLVLRLLTIFPPLPFS